MPVRELTLPGGKLIKLGRVAPLVRRPALDLANYVGTLPLRRSSPSYRLAAARSRKRVYKNDALGDCVVAAWLHAIGLWTANAGAEVEFTDEQAVQMYSTIGGYVPGDPSTDRGCVITDMLAYAQHTGIDGHKIAGYLAVDAKDPALVRAGVEYFLNVIFGVDLPDAWLDEVRPGFVWDAGAINPANGHCICATDYGPDGVWIDTWGLEGTLTNAAVALCDEAYIAVSRDVLSAARQRSPMGLDWGKLAADFTALGGTVA